MVKKLKLLLVFLLCAHTTSYAQEYKKMIAENSHRLSEIQEEAEKYFENNGTGKGTGYKQYKRWEYFAMKQLDVNGYVKDPNYLFNELNTQNQRRNAKSSDQVLDNGANWSELGPTYFNETTGWNPGVGRISSFAVENNNHNHIIIGSIGGGIWKTINKGKTWSSLTDNHGNMYTYSLAMDPLNNQVYYWGASNGQVYKSIDGGATWQKKASAGYGNVLKILVHPTQTNIVYLCNEYRGLYKSFNGGETWELLVEGMFYDVEFDPNNAETIFASTYGIYGATGGFFRSTDGGKNFLENKTFPFGVKMIGVSKANSNIVYVVEERWRRFNALYKSEDNGVTFQKLDHSNKNYFGYEYDASDRKGQAPRDMGIAVSPTNPDEVHIAGINTWRSMDGGISFVNTSQWTIDGAKNLNIGYCHADVDDLEFVGNDLFVVTDGGIFLSEDTTNLTAEYYKDLTTGLGIRQFYKLGVSQTNPVVITAGAQDNGSSIYRGGREAKDAWIDWLGADGMEGLVDVNNPMIVYGTTQFGSLYKTTTQGNDAYWWQTITKSPGRGNWVTPLEQDQNGNLYYGSRSVHKSTDGSRSWQQISQDLGRNATLVKIAPSNPDIVYASIYYGNEWNLPEELKGRTKIYRTLDGGRSQEWVKLKGFKGEVNSIAIHPTDPNKIAVALSGAEEKVIISTDGGGSWIHYSHGLPNFSPYALEWDDNKRDGLYVGMDYGVYYRDMNMQEWESYSNNLPNVRISELEVNYADGHLYVATYGRGIWKSPRATYNSFPGDHGDYLDTIQVYPNPVSGEYLYIKGDKEETVAIRLFDSKGHILRYFNGVALKNEPYRMSIAYLPKGIYFVRINSNDLVVTKKVIIE